MDTMVPDIPNLKDDLIAELLLDIEIPFLRVRRLQIVLDACNIERRLGCARAEDWHSNAEGDGRAWHNREAGRRPDGILRKPFFEVIEWNRIVINSESGADNCLASRDKVGLRRPGKRHARAEVALGGVVNVSP